jgi:hypothetical protein
MDLRQASEVNADQLSKSLVVARRKWVAKKEIHAQRHSDCYPECFHDERKQMAMDDVTVPCGGCLQLRCHHSPLGSREEAICPTELDRSSL